MTQKAEEEKKTRAVGKKAKGTSGELLLFEKYSMSEVKVEDPGLAGYINLTPITVPHGSARFANKQFGKTKVSIIERLINGMMRTEKYTGKKMKACKAVMITMDLIHRRTKENPVQVLVRALEHSGPKEEATRLKFGGISVPKAVDTAPSRRLDVALRNICRGAVASSHKNKKRIWECLANEIMKAAGGDMSSFAITKKEEMERIAASAR